MRETLIKIGLPIWQADGLIEDYAHYSRSEAAEVTTEVQDATGRPPRSFDDFASDYAQAFSPHKRSRRRARDGYLCFDRLKGAQSSVHQLFPSEREAIEHLARTRLGGRLFPISRIQVGRVMKKYCRLAGIPEHKSHHHALKHSTYMNMLAVGAQINEVQRFRGHKSLNSTAQYLRVSHERACRAFAGVAL